MFVVELHSILKCGWKTFSFNLENVVFPMYKNVKQQCALFIFFLLVQRFLWEKKIIFYRNETKYKFKSYKHKAIHRHFHRVCSLFWWMWRVFDSLLIYFGWKCNLKKKLISGTNGSIIFDIFYPRKDEYIGNVVSNIWRWQGTTVHYEPREISANSIRSL